METEELGTLSAIEPCTELLTAEGVERLGTDTSPWMRAQTAATVAVLFVEGALNEQERAYAVSILESLARDLETKVREALSEHVKHCALLPRSIAQSLAMDVESVALPIIRYSSVLDEADLLAVVRAGGAKKRIAVAQRDDLTGAVSDALADTQVRWVVGALLANESAQIGEATYGKILDYFCRDEKIQALMAERPALPATIIARMVVRVSEALRWRLIERYGLPEEIAGNLTARACERALSDSMGQLGESETMESLSKRLHREGALTSVFLLRALCMGQLRLFIAGMAVRAEVSVGNADELIRDDGQRGLMSIYLHAGLPGDLTQQQPREGRTPADEVHPRGDREVDPFEQRAAAFERRLDALIEIRQHLGQHGIVECGLVAEVVDDGRAPDADLLGDVFEPGRSEAVLGKELLRSIDDGLQDHGELN